VVNYDVIVIGAGIAGTSLAAELSVTGKVLLIEAEAQPGFHATGRSAALFSELYGPPAIRALSRASRDFLFHPPTDFTDDQLVKARGTLFVATHGQMAALDKLRQSETQLASRISAARACALCPILRDDVVAGAVYEPGACDIDVSGLHMGYLRQFRKMNGVAIMGSPVEAMARVSGAWCVTAGGTEYSAPIVVNAAGAWADAVAAMGNVAPLGLSPLRRTAVLVDPPADQDSAHWPMVIDIDEQFYFKPDAGKLLLSPADETPSPPCDAQPDEWDIAVAVDRVTAVANINVRRVSHSWAGLRTFAPDRLPIVGFDTRADGFFWLAGQGGYGVQTAPALGKLAAALVHGSGAQILAGDSDLTTDILSPQRF
jgi:D-arginine dehydrogenase